MIKQIFGKLPRKPSSKLSQHDSNNNDVPNSASMNSNSISSNLGPSRPLSNGANPLNRGKVLGNQVSTTSDNFADQFVTVSRMKMKKLFVE